KINLRWKFAIDCSRNRWEQVPVASVHTTPDGKNVIVSEVKRVNQIRAEDVIPIATVGEINVRRPEAITIDLDRQDMLGVSEGPEVVNAYREMIGIAPVHVSLDVKHRTIRVNGTGDGSRRRVVVDDPWKIRPGQILQPSRGRAVCQARIR